MADNVGVTTGTGAVVGTDERTINGIAGVQIQRVDEQGSTAAVFGQVAMTAAAAVIVAARDTRKRLTITNWGSAPVVIGLSGVTFTTGFQVAPNGGSVDVQSTVAVYGICAAAGTSTVHYIEEYDA